MSARPACAKASSIRSPSPSWTEIGLDISRHKPMTFEELEEWEGLNFDLIVTLAPEAHHRALELTRTSAVDVEYWPTADPSAVEGSREQRLDAYRDGARPASGAHPRSAFVARRARAMIMLSSIARSRVRRIIRLRAETSGRAYAHALGQRNAVVERAAIR